ncbi:Exodeoxyribonuclease I subunit D [Paenibacillus algorifonticola]|uniref:Exodeoxyribonuclease I subunit D n=1 Tax=Paenibacillus algorifonticola TaxID=684063 RepID=A0A1I2GZG0_9BACL|nr:metallophosphoesterase [Paenibacillus algorifonticola]SFF22540.1 Exodeoxyribonuclease I subunit D [Paenibacillus algorifonticola]
MKIAHVADSHWGFGYAGPTPASRFEDITSTMDWVASRIITEECELVLFAGDAFKDARVFIDRATAEIQAFVAWLRRLSYAGIEVIVISGTPSHDAISAYHLIREMQIPRVQVFTEPENVHVHGVNIACLPGMNRSNFATEAAFAGLPPHEFHSKMTEWITDQCRDLADYATAYHAGEAVPTILLSHLSFDLADTGFEDALLQNEPILTDEAARMFDLVCLGHIHRPQFAGSNVYYSGAPERHNFGDEHTEPGFWIHDTETFTTKFANSEFIKTFARRFKTIDWCDMDIQAWLDGQVDDFASIQDAIVRVRYACSEELQKQFDRRSLEKALYDAGAFFVAEIRAEVERSERIRDVEVTEGLSPLTALAAWGNNQGLDADEIEELLAMTTDLMEEPT